MQDVERYRQRNKIQVASPTYQLESQQYTTNQLVCRTPPPAERPLQAPLQLVIPEKILYGLDILIRGSFESGAWKFHDNERLIESSPTAALEQRRIMNFLNGIDLGCTAARSGNNMLAGDQWRRAFLELENLVKGTYHDIIPNLISKLNDLNNWGFADIASMMIRHIAQLCLEYQKSNYPVSLIFTHFDGVSLDCISGLEDQIMALFHKVFYVYLGSQCYNTFVMMMNRAKRRLSRCEWVDIDQCLPPLLPLDDMFGPANCRPLDVLRLRVEVLYQRMQYQRVTEEAFVLVQRADTKQNDPWQRHYFLIKGLYHAGSAHYYLGNHESAKQCLGYALYLQEEFCKIDVTDQFNSERILMQEKLELLGVTPLAYTTAGSVLA